MKIKFRLQLPPLSNQWLTRNNRLSARIERAYLKSHGGKSRLLGTNVEMALCATTDAGRVLY